MQRLSRRLALLVLLPSLAMASDGKWMPEQLLSMDPQWLKSQGLELPASSLWNAKEGNGLLSAAVSLGGCSAAFVSPDGLIITNHHCLFAIVQQHSSTSRDLIKDGYLARTRADELQGSAERVFVPRRFTDVTREFQALVKRHADPAERYRAISRRRHELEAKCDRPPDLRCDVRVYDDGRIFMLVETLQLSDVRLVYAPPGAVGNYGGEIDNWMWPRHTGDFAIARAYVAPDGSPREFHKDNVPYRPRFHLPLSTEGVEPGDFVAVLGYPGSTSRRLVAAELADRVEHDFPLSEKALGEWLAIIDEVSKSDNAARIATANTRRSLANRHKNLQGQLEGFKKRGLIARQQRHEAEIVKFASGKSEHAAALTARQTLIDQAGARDATRERDFLLGVLRPGSTSPSKALWMAVQIARISEARQQADVDRDADLRERELPRLLERISREQRSVSPAAERRFAAWFADHARALPKDARISAFDATFGTRKGKALDQRIASILRQTKVLDPKAREAMLTQTPAQLKARKDPLLTLGFALAADYERMQDEHKRLAGTVYAVRTAWMAAVEAHAGRPVAPDANSTLRISIGRVQGYTPRDAVQMLPQTTLSGMLAKDTGVEPFDVPAKVKEAAGRSKNSRWRDAKLRDVPVNFLADLDTTGGNSGSPVIDSKGRFVGANFDRVWENITNDYGFDPAIARNVTAEVRYLLWNLEEVEQARELLEELKIPAPATAKGLR